MFKTAKKLEALVDHLNLDYLNYVGRFITKTYDSKKLYATRSDLEHMEKWIWEIAKTQELLLNHLNLKVEEGKRIVKK